MAVLVLQQLRGVVGTLADKKGLGGGCVGGEPVALGFQGKGIAALAEALCQGLLALGVGDSCGYLGCGVVLRRAAAYLSLHAIGATCGNQTDALVLGLQGGVLLRQLVEITLEGLQRHVVLELEALA